MKFRAVLIAAALSGRLLVSVAQAAGPDDLYLDAYRLIQEGDQFTSAGQGEIARQRYADAEANLKKIQSSYPEYNKNAVEFRLDYIHAHTKTLPAPKPENAATAAPKLAPASPAEQIRDLNNRVAQLEADNTMLQAKLKEALAPQPAALDPHEFARAQERINQLEKEKELLRANLQQAQAKQPAAADNALLDQARGELDATKKKLVENVAAVASLTQENQRLQQQLANPPKAPAADPTALKEAQANAANLEKERDNLQRKLAEANKEVADLRNRKDSAGNSTLTNQLANLRARLEVFESRKVPYTPDELALMDKNIPKIAIVPEAKPSKRSPRELPAGSSILVADAERAFAAKRFNEAEAKYKEVLKMDDENPVSLANLAAIQIQEQKFDEAEANLKKAIAVHADDGYALSLMGMMQVQQGKYEQGLDTLSRSAQLDPKNPETQNYLGIALSQQGHREAAETALRKAVALNPNYAGAHYNLALVYAAQHPPFLELAKYHYNKALALGQSPNPELEKQLAGAK
jgi:Tfp pilus assembly protein PilF